MAFGASRETPSMGVVLNENGVVVDHAAVAAGGFVPRERQEALVEAIAALAERNGADFVVLNTALGVQTAAIQRALAARLRSEVRKEGASMRRRVTAGNPTGPTGPMEEPREQKCWWRRTR